MKTIPKIDRVTATVDAPASKSYTARALLLAAMTEGTTRVVRALDCDDSRYMLEAIRKIGYDVSGTFKEGLAIGERVGISANEMEIDVGNAGTAMRFLAGFLSFTPGRYVLRGDSRMHERPIGDLVDALARMGVELEYLEREGFPPLRLRGRLVRGGFHVWTSGEISSQFVSSILMAGSRPPGGLTVHATSLSSRPYIDVTRDVVKTFGGRIDEIEPDVFAVKHATLALAEYAVEGDFSSASYWFAAAAATRGSVTVTNLRRDSAQGDARFLEILGAMGCEVAWNDDAATVRGGELRGGTFDCNSCPDIVPTLAAIAPLATTPVEITNVANLRVKESDRIAVIAQELRNLGASLDEWSDGFRVAPGWGGDAATIDSHNDHRIAMAFAIAGLARGNVEIAGEQAVSKSYPRFWRTLDEVVATSTGESA